MKTTHTLHTARLNNNCPTCFATDGLELAFTQEKTDTKFYEKAERDINSKLFCHTCGNNIFPVNWTDDIERVYEYNRKLATPRHAGISLKPLFYVLILLAVILVAAVVYYMIG